jgi:hypothetical protein
VSETVATYPGKLGDALMQWPVMYQWSQQTGKTFTAWLDEKTCAGLKNLFESQACCDKVEFKPGIENYMAGGQPFHFNLESSDFKDRTVYHMGYRSFPVRQLTLESAENAKLSVKIDRRKLAQEPSFSFSGIEQKNRVVLHGNPICPHTRSTPQFWKFLSGIAEELSRDFDEIVFVGSERDREVGTRAYGRREDAEWLGNRWQAFDDGGDWLPLARLVAGSRLVIACGSAVAALGGALKIPTIRVHDPIGGHSKNIWSSLGDNQINDTEIELRKSWPEFRDRWLAKEGASA